MTGDLKVWAEIVNVELIRLPGYWTHKEGLGYSIKNASAPQPSEKVAYHLHNGVYTHLLIPTKNLTAAIARGFLQFVEPVVRVFAVEYSLVSGKPLKSEYTFHMQLLDALAGYNYLMNVVGTDVPLLGPPELLILISP